MLEYRSLQLWSNMKSKQHISITSFFPNPKSFFISDMEDFHLWKLHRQTDTELSKKRCVCYWTPYCLPLSDIPILTSQWYWKLHICWQKWTRPMYVNLCFKWETLCFKCCVLSCLHLATLTYFSMWNWIINCPNGAIRKVFSIAVSGDSIATQLPWICR